MKKVICVVFALVFVLDTIGCAYSHRHPKLTKTAFISAGVAAGVAIGYQYRGKTCHYTYEGRPYFGTTCPAPKGDR